MFVLQCIWYLAPMGIANVAPVLVRRHFSALAVPVDRFLGNRGVFGSHKTVRGILVAPLAGTIAFALQQLLSTVDLFAGLGFFAYPAMTLWFGFFAGLGAIVGDLLRSAVKRRVHIRPGGRFIPFDQVDYLIGGMLFTVPFYQPSLPIVLTTLLVGALIHGASSWLGYLLHLKDDRL